MDGCGSVSSYGVVTWNAGGLHRGTDGGRQRGDWLLNEWGKDGSLGVMAIQETHCKNDGDLCDSVRDLSVRMTVIHSPAVDGDAWGGVMLFFFAGLGGDWERGWGSWAGFVFESEVWLDCGVPEFCGGVW